MSKYFSVVPIRHALFALFLSFGLIQGALAALFISSPSDFGTVLSDESNCDDCSSGPYFFGAGHDLEFFGNTYDALYVSSNGYVTFGGGHSAYSSQPLDTQSIAPMIAGLFTDLDSSSDADSQVFVNTSVPGQIVVTWYRMGIWPQLYSGRATFQLVIRSDQSPIPSGEGQIGFFYDAVTFDRNASAGFGDGLSDVNPGEVAFHTQAPASDLNNAAPRWYNLSGGVPVTPPTIAVTPVPTLSQWAMILLSFMLLVAGGLVQWRQTRR